MLSDETVHRRVRTASTRYGSKIFLWNIEYATTRGSIVLTERRQCFRALIILFPFLGTREKQMQYWMVTGIRYHLD